jgi:hypothetical protein
MFGVVEMLADEAANKVQHRSIQVAAGRAVIPLQAASLSYR